MWILNFVDLEETVHDVEGLCRIFVEVVLDVVTVGLKGHNLSPWKRKDFLNGQVVLQLAVELGFLDFVDGSDHLCIENDIVVTPHHVSLYHGFRLAYDLEGALVD